MKKYSLLLSLAGLMVLIGCAGIEPPMPDKLLTHPLGAGPIHAGMTKDEVREVYGEPDLIQNTSESNDKGATARQEWIYYGRMQRLPISYGYLSKPMRVYFDGKNVTSFKEE